MMARLVLLARVPGHAGVTAALYSPRAIQDAKDHETFLIDCAHVMGLQFYETWAEIILGNGKALSVHHPKADELVRLIYGDAP